MEGGMLLRYLDKYQITWRFVKHRTERVINKTEVLFYYRVYFWKEAINVSFVLIRQVKYMSDVKTGVVINEAGQPVIQLISMLIRKVF